MTSLPPKATLRPTPFKVSIPDATLEEMKLLIKASKVAPETYESSFSDRRYGVTREWMINAKDQWENHFDWYALCAGLRMCSDGLPGVKLKSASTLSRTTLYPSQTMMAKPILYTSLLSSLKSWMRFHWSCYMDGPVRRLDPR